MTEASNRRTFLLKAAAAAAAASSVVACGGSDSVAVSSSPAQFTFGVASGDPLSDRVILWTYAKVPNSNAAVPLTWQVATDSGFNAVVSSGQIDALEANGFTAKVDAAGLTPGATYFYRFRDALGTSSTVGTTRTLPPAGVASVKLAIFSCSLYSEGFFNVYAEAAKSDALYALHLGDYIYEYGSDPAKFGSKDGEALGRVAVPANDISTLADYRARYAQYKADADLQALHAKMPWITIWDDHEFANNAYVNGAENHNPATQGDWLARKNIAAKVYHEWMPIRTPDPANLLKIYRRFDFGRLLSLHMLDTRIEGRDRQYDNFGDADGGIARYVTGITPDANGLRPDAARRMMSAEQQTWLTSGLTESNATWQFLGNQDIMARMWFPGSVLQAQSVATTAPTAANQAAVAAAINAYLTAKAVRATAGAAALTPTQAALLNTRINPTLPYNLDAWDGYPANRDAILNTVKSLNKNLVVLSGDSHNGWFTNLTTLAGVKVGVEFATTSVTSPGFESVGLGGLAASLDGSALIPQLGAAAVDAGLGLVDDLNYADTIRRGFLQITVTAASVKGEYVYVDSVKSKTYAAAVGKTITVAAPTTLGAVGAITYA
jgi:alkaline phosphatase D